MAAMYCILFLNLFVTIASRSLYPDQVLGSGDVIPESDIDTSFVPCNKFVSLLNDAQKKQLQTMMDDQRFLARLEQLKLGEDITLSAMDMEKRMVTFTPLQKRQILGNFGELFTKRPEEEFEEQSQERLQNLLQRKERSVPGPRICQPVQRYDAMQIGIDENYNPVQIVQVSTKVVINPNRLVINKHSMLECSSSNRALISIAAI